MKTRTGVTPVSWRELLKDMAFPAKCPVCGDVIPLEQRLLYRQAVFDTENAGRPFSLINPGSGLPPGRSDNNFNLKLQYAYAGLVCDPCKNSFHFIEKPYCEKCGRSLGRAGQLLCSDCASGLRLFRQCRCVVNYDEMAQEVMAGLKYASRREYASLLAVMAADRLGDWITGTGTRLLIPVPVHSSRLKQRGYNQAELIADGIGKLLGIPVDPGVLVRERRTAAQKGLAAGQRLANLQGAFRPGRKLKGKPTVMIVDDIYTTGSTMEACSEVLTEAGAGEVYGLCICSVADE